ncbi:MAG: glycoside hydrolase family 108 protein [Shewanella sp.]
MAVVSTAERWTKRGIIAAKVNIEAGYVNNPKDLGKATNHGVTEATAREFGYKGDMRDLTIEQAFDIYDRGWWKRMRLDEIMTYSPMLADRMFDFGINAGRANCIKSLQRILNVLNRGGKLYSDIDADGGIGRLTLDALAGFAKARKEEGIKRLAFVLSSHQVTYYTEISEKRMDNEEFTYGWYGRVEGEMPEFAKMTGWVK